MTDITKHVPDLKTCEMLRDAGFPQETYFHWVRRKNAWMLWDETGHSEFETGREQKWIAAPLASEIMEMLPNKYAFSKCGGINFSNDWTVFNCDDVDESETVNTNPATACALMWLRLRKDGIKCS